MENVAIFFAVIIMIGVRITVRHLIREALFGPAETQSSWERVLAEEEANDRMFGTVGR